MKPRTPAVARKHAVEHQRVKVDVEIERPAEALQDDNRAAAAARDAPLTQPATETSEHGPHEESRHRAAALVIPRQAVAQPMRQRQHPVPDRHVGQDVVDEMRGAFRHAPATAARTEAAPFAGERDHALSPAPRAAQAREAARQPPHRSKSRNSCSTKPGNPSPSRRCAACAWKVSKWSRTT